MRQPDPPPMKEQYRAARNYAKRMGATIWHCQHRDGWLRYQLRYGPGQGPKKRKTESPPPAPAPAPKPAAKKEIARGLQGELSLTDD